MKKALRMGRDCKALERVVTDEAPVGDPEVIGTPDAPIWNHLAEL